MEDFTERHSCDRKQHCCQRENAKQCSCDRNGVGAAGQCQCMSLLTGLQETERTAQHFE